MRVLFWFFFQGISLSSAIRVGSLMKCLEQVTHGIG